MHIQHPTLDLCLELISRQSITPEDAGCQQLLADRLSTLGFHNEYLPFADTLNLWSRLGDQGPVFCFAGHTDVVPPGDLNAWSSPPFKPTIRHTEKGDYLVGRGTADMKGSLAAMIVATERFLQKHPKPKGSIAFLFTSDEEGPFINGTTKVIDTLEARNEKITWCVVGEPSSSEHIADTIKIGRRGSLTGYLTFYGQQGHVAYPQFASNAIHNSFAALQYLVEQKWDEGNTYFPATSFQIVGCQSGVATNVIPGEMKVEFNFRFSTEQCVEQLQQQVKNCLQQHQLSFDLQWKINGQPFLTRPGKLITSTQKVIQKQLGYDCVLSTAGGTSDGRFIAPTGADVIELGPVNQTIHQINEEVSINDLVVLTDLYEQILIELLT